MSIKLSLAAVATLALFGASNANAAVLLTLDNPNQTAPAGSDVLFTGTVTNLNPFPIQIDSTSPVVDSPNSVNDDFGNTTPVLLAAFPNAGDSTGDILLFDIPDVQFPDPSLGHGYTVQGNYSVTDLGDNQDSNIVDFTILVTPEPGAIAMMGSCFFTGGGLFLARRRRK